MRTLRLPAALAALAALLVIVLAAGCGASSGDLSVVEGEPVTLGDLTYNVVITRYLNPNDIEDRAYLQGAPSLPAGDYYLGVFMQVHNAGGTAQSLPQGFSITDTQGQTFKPASLTNDFALPLGSPLGAGAKMPDPESAAANGPIEGSLVLFLVSQAATEDRPLMLRIPSAAGAAGEVQLDL